jgi:hypothetical protein
MQAIRLLAKLVAYYLILAVLVWVGLKIFPSWHEYLPVGRLQSLIANGGSTNGSDVAAAMAKSNSANVGHVQSLLGSILWLVSAMVGALLATLPISWVYMDVRDREQYDQSLIGTIVVLPVVVAGIVVLVQDSLALSFSLAGIAGVANFRNTLKSPGDLLFVLVTIGIGLSSGIGAVELATVMSVAFSLCFTVLWFTQYGERHYMKRYLSDFDPNDEHSRLAAAMAKGETVVMTKTSKKSETVTVETEAHVPAPESLEPPKA